MSRTPRLFGQQATNSPWSVGANGTQTQNSGFANWFQPNKQLAATNPADQQMLQSVYGEVQTLNQRLSQFDSDNQQLLTEIAGLKQRLTASNDYNYQLKQQLADSVTQLQQIQTEKVGLEQRLASAQINGGVSGMQTSMSGGVPSQLPGGAVLRANNSLLQKMSLIQLPGVTTRMDGDVIRVEIPSDQLFVPGSYQINQSYGQILQQVASSIRTNFPEQIIGVEAHWDNTPLQNMSAHQFTATQCLSVFDQLIRIGLPEKQLFTMAMGNNRPRHTAGVANNGVSPNRRVEIVIYPETWNSR